MPMVPCAPVTRRIRSISGGVAGPPAVLALRLLFDVHRSAAGLAGEGDLAGAPNDAAIAERLWERIVEAGDQGRLWLEQARDDRLVRAAATGDALCGDLVPQGPYRAAA